jgi:hypothetical protein
MVLNFDICSLSILVADATYVTFGIINDLTNIILPTIVMFLFFQEFIIFSDFIKWVKKLTNKKFDNGEHSPIFPPGGVAVPTVVRKTFVFR